MNYIIVSIFGISLITLVSTIMSYVEAKRMNNEVNKKHFTMSICVSATVFVLSAISLCVN